MLLALEKDIQIRGFFLKFFEENLLKLEILNWLELKELSVANLNLILNSILNSLIFKSLHNMASKVYTNRYRKKRSSQKNRTSSLQPSSGFQTDKQAYVKFLE